MPHESRLIALIAIGFVLALGFGLLVARLRMPPLLGYLLAGVAIGPFTPGFVGDAQLAGELAEIGVILLMFGVGLHFSIDTLLQVRRIALPGAMAQIAVATAVAALMASAWGWPLVSGLVFGLSLSVASTVVLLRALQQRNELDSGAGRIAVGWLIVEDLVMVLALVFLPLLAGSAQGAAMDVPALLRSFGFTALKVALFVALMLAGGRRMVPWLLGVVARTGSRELFTLAILAIALGIAYGSAQLFGVSFALGAFFAGVVLAETDLSRRAAENSLPLQDAFAVLFFISVGMLFNPKIVIEQPMALLGVLFVVLIGKSLAAFAIVLAFGHTVRTALTISASLAQIGEFSFILAGLGVTLGLLPAAARDLILAGALLSITINPLAFASVAPVGHWLQRRAWLRPLLQRAERDDQESLQARMSSLRDHAVIVGHGRVGSIVCRALADLQLPHVVIESDRELAEQMRRQGTAVIYGDATSNDVLDRAHLGQARLLVIASPDGYQARRMLERARAVNPAMEVLVRTHSADELQYLLQHGAAHAVMGELELALQLTGNALQAFGVADERQREVVATLRASVRRSPDASSAG